jgi:hypothetical protein
MITPDELVAALAEMARPSSPDSYHRAFRTALHSGHADAVRRALEDYRENVAFMRHGASNPLEDCADEVLSVAREVLGRPPSPEEEFLSFGDNHIAALAIMAHLADEEDADLIAAILEGAQTESIRYEACHAASAPLSDAVETPLRLIAALKAVVFDETLDLVTREVALNALGRSETPEADDALLRAIELSDITLQVYAALDLIRPRLFRVHRERVTRLAASWGEGPGFGVDDVRKAVAGFHSVRWTGATLDDPLLRSTHERLMFSSSDEECIRAFLTLLRSDDTVAVGIALDHYKERDGLDWALLDWTAAEECLPEVLDRARAVLRQPPSAAELSPEYGEGANHRSALAVMTYDRTGPDDADLIADFLRRASTDAVRREAVWVASFVLDRVKAPQIVGALRDLLLGPPADFTGAKEQAIRVLSEDLGAEADDILLEVLFGDNPEAQAHAVYWLVRSGGLDRHGDLLVELAECWGERAPAHPWGDDPITMVLGKLHSEHWEGLRLADPRLHLAHRELRKPGPASSRSSAPTATSASTPAPVSTPASAPTPAPASGEGRLRAFRTLLDSGDPAAVGIALDHWWSSSGLVRHLGEDGRDAERPHVLARVREVLREPPTPASLSPRVGEGANHLSALEALRVSGTVEVEALVHILDAAVNERVRWTAVSAVGSLVEEAEGLDPRLIEALADLACDDDVEIEIRVGAVRVLEEVPGGQARAALVRVAGCPEEDMQVAAAYALTSSEEHRELIERLVASWPAERDSWEVRSIRESLL